MLLSTLTNAVFANGGVKNTGSLRNIELKRNGQLLSTFDFYDVLLKGDTRSDLRLMTGDVVFIPPITKKIGIAGEVERPGIYELKDNETADDLINFAGTLKPKADLASIEIQTIDSLGNGFNLNKIDLNVSSFSDLSLANGDILTIHPVLDRMKKAILLSGHTQKTGFYPWTQGMKLLDVISSPNDLLPMTDMNYVLIKREDNSNQKNKILQVDLEELFVKSNTDINLALKERDEIIFFPAFLTPDLINVELIEGEYNNQDEQKTLAYTMRSLQESIVPAREPVDAAPAIVTETETPPNFFQYTIHNYCSLNVEYVEALINDEEETLPLTSYCRRQVLDPMIELLMRQSRSGQTNLRFLIYMEV